MDAYLGLHFLLMATGCPAHARGTCERRRRPPPRPLPSARDRLGWAPSAPPRAGSQAAPPAPPPQETPMRRRLPLTPLGLLFLAPAAPAGTAARARPKLYVTNSEGDDVTVVDVATNKPV